MTDDLRYKISDELLQVARYAHDFPKARRIYPTEREAAKALMAEAERQKWRRAG